VIAEARQAVQTHGSAEFAQSMHLARFKSTEMDSESMQPLQAVGSLVALHSDTRAS